MLIPDRRPYADLHRRLPLDMPAVLVHRGKLPRGQLQRARPMRTTLPRALVDAARCYSNPHRPTQRRAASNDQARTVIAAAGQQRLVTPEEIREVILQMPRARRRALVLETLADVAGGATALAEIDFVRLCRRFRLPAPDLPEPRKDGSGRNRYLDAYWRPRRLHVEVDGAHHMDARHWEADMRRQNEVWIAGDRVLRFTAWQVRHRPEEVANQLRAALKAAGWSV